MRTDTFHNFIAEKFKEKIEDDFGNIIKREVARKVLYINHVPLDLHNSFLGEMEELDLIKLKDKQNIEILI